MKLRAIVTAMVIALTTPALADIYGQPIVSVVDLFIAVCTASDECNP